MKNLSIKDQKSLIKDWRENNNEKSLKQLIESNKKLVHKIAQRQYKSNKNLDYDDLVQEGFLGLSIAAEKFDLNKDNKFITYATGWVMQRIKAYVISNRSLVRLGTTQDNRKIFYYYSKVRTKVDEEYPDLSKEEKTQIICKIMGVKRKNLDKMLNVINGYDVSLDAKVGIEENGTLHDLIPDKNSTFFNDFEEKDCEAKFSLALNVIMEKDLSEEESIVIRSRFFEKLTYDQIAKKLKFSRQYVMTREQSAIKIIKAKMKLRFGLDKSCFF